MTNLIVFKKRLLYATRSIAVPVVAVSRMLRGKNYAFSLPGGADDIYKPTEHADKTLSGVHTKERHSPHTHTHWDSHSTPVPS